MIKNNIEDITEVVSTWLTNVVIGLNLCPFAASPVQQKRVRIKTSEANTETALLIEIQSELKLMDATAVEELETTLLIAPYLLKDFADYNQFLNRVDDLLQSFGWLGVYQIASFHPGYQFAKTSENDAENLTNRAPYPIFHLLREDSLERAVDDYPDTAQIPKRNIEKMNALTEQQRLKYFPYLFK